MPRPRIAIAGLALVLLVPACTPSVPDEDRAATLTALARMHDWLERARPTDGTAFGFHCLDAWSWFMLSEWHPDAGLRARAAEATDARLRALPGPPQWTGVTLSYWALALRLMAHRGLPLEPHLDALADVDVAGALAATGATTRWWTILLLQQAGAAVGAPDPTGTFLEQHTAEGERAGSITLMQVYSLYHEIAPAAGLGLAPLAGLGEAQTETAQRIVPSTIDVGTRSGDTDALAEALVAAALLDRRDAPAYRAGLRTLLAAQNPDGSFRSRRDAQRRVLDTDHYRHVVVVATFALLTSLREFQPAVHVPAGA